MDLSPKKRRFSFSLRTLIVFFTVCCLFLGWWTNSANRQKRVVAWVEEQKGTVYYDWQYDDFGEVDETIELEANWLRDLLGIDYFHTVIGVNFNFFVNVYSSQVRDLSPLADLTNLRLLDLSGTQVSDLSPLANLKKLKQLNLQGTQVSDFSPLADLKNLKKLNLDHTKVSDLSPLTDLKNLTWLRLNGTQVSDLSPLAKLKNLEWIDVRNTPVSDDQIQKLKKALPNVAVER